MLCYLSAVDARWTHQFVAYIHACIRVGRKHITGMMIPYQPVTEVNVEVSVKINDSIK